MMTLTYKFLSNLISHDISVLFSSVLTDFSTVKEMNTCEKIVFLPKIVYRHQIKGQIFKKEKMITKEIAMKYVYGYDMNLVKNMGRNNRKIKN